MKFAGTSVILIAMAAASAQAQTFSFDDPVTLAPSQTPDAWYTDRYAPQVFDSQVMFGGDNRLQLGLRSAGQDGNRGSQNGSFYNYQGRKFDMPTGTEIGSSVSIDMFADSTWASGARAGMWTTMSNGNLTYPIIEFAVDGDNGDGGSFTGFRWWQSGIGWTEAVGMTADDQWYTMTISLTASDVLFDITSVLSGSSIFSASVDNLGAHAIDNVILQGHNQGIAGEYDIYYDNFVINSVPTPGALALLSMGGIAAIRRRR